MLHRAWVVGGGFWGRSPCPNARGGRMPPEGPGSQGLKYSSTRGTRMCERPSLGPGRACKAPEGLGHCQYDSEDGDGALRLVKASHPLRTFGSAGWSKRHDRKSFCLWHFLPSRRRWVGRHECAGQSLTGPQDSVSIRISKPDVCGGMSLTLSRA